MVAIAASTAALWAMLKENVPQGYQEICVTK
jgi:hypothetical protein